MVPALLTLVVPEPEKLSSALNLPLEMVKDLLAPVISKVTLLLPKTGATPPCDILKSPCKVMVTALVADQVWFLEL